MNIQESLKLAQVKRYAICHMNRDQSVAEHSFNVTLIAIDLLTSTDQKDEGLYWEVIGYSLMHDMDEVLTGDIPSPFKRRLRAECPGAIPILDGEPKASKKARDIVKMADYLESIHYIREFGGSRYTTTNILADIYAQFESALEKSTLPKSIIERAKCLADLL